MARPLWVTGFTCFVVLLSAPLLPLNVVLVLAGLGLVFFAIALLVPALRKQRALWAALLAAVAALGVFAGNEMLSYRPLIQLDGRTVYLESRVTWSDGTAVLEVTGGEAPKGSRIAFYPSEGGEVPDLYSTVKGQFTLTAKDTHGLNGLQTKARGVYMMAWCPEYGVQSYIEEPGVPPWTAVFAQMRRRACETLTGSLPGDRGCLASGICFGEDQDLSVEAKAAFRSTGVAHLLAVSGLHMSVIAFAVLGLLRRLYIPQRPAFLLTMAGVLCFMALVGLEVSVVRSGVMLLILLLGSTLRRRPDSLNSMGLALLVLLLSNPYCVYDVSLLLSFGACLGLLCLYPWMRDQVHKWLDPAEVLPAEALPDAEAEKKSLPLWKRGRNKAVDALCVSLSAVLPTMTVSAVFFGNLSLIAPVTNLLTVFPASLLMQMGCLAAVLEPVPFLVPICRVLLMGVGWIAGYLLDVTQWLSRLPFATAALRDGYLLLWLPAALGLLYLGWRLRKGRGLRLAGAVAVIALLCGVNLRNLAMRDVTTVAAAGTDGDAAVLLQRNGRYGAMLSMTNTKTAARLRSLLADYGVTRLDFLVVTEGEANTLVLVPGMFGEYLQDTPLLYPQDDPDFVRLAQSYSNAYPLEEARITFWQEDTLAWRDGWLRLTMGDTRVLLSSGNTDASVLPLEWRNTHLVLYTGAPPAHVGAITAQTGILLCEEEKAAGILKAIPRTAYPVTAVPDYGQAAVVTRGKGDLSWKSWL